MDKLALAKLYKKERKYNLALKELKKAIELGFDNDDVHLELAWIYHDIDDNDSAIKELKKVIELGRDNNEVRLGLAKLYREKEEYDKAIEELKIALSHHHPDGRVYHGIGWIHREKGEYDLSVKDFEKASKMEPYNDGPFSKNMIHNEIEISQRKAILESKPMVLGVTLTHRCNIKCKMCEVRKKPWDIPEMITREIIGLFPYLQHIYWQGGEPFLSGYFEELFEKASTYPNLSQIIVTNGLLINEKWAEKLVGSNVDIIYSIDGTTKETYEKIRDGARFEDLIESINIVNEYRRKYPHNNRNTSTQMTTTMQAVIMKSNYYELEKLVDFALKYNFNCLNIIPIRYTDKQENIFLNKDLQALEYVEKVMPGLLEKSEDSGLKLFNQLPKVKNIDSYSEDSDSQNCPSIKTKKILCYWPWKSLYILRDGKVKPYGFCEEHVGDINQDSLQDIWNSEAMQTYRQKLLDDDNLEWCSFRCTSGVMPKNSLMLD